MRTFLRGVAASSLFLATTLLSTAVAGPIVCTLDDCALPGAAHHVDGVHLGDYEDGRAVLGGAWSWMLHDLAEARTELRYGHRASGLARLAQLDRALRAQAPAMQAALGPDTVVALHDALRDASDSAGGHPMAALVLPAMDAVPAPAGPENGTTTDTAAVVGVEDPVPDRS